MRFAVFGFHRYLAKIPGYPILILIMDFIDNILRDIKMRLNLAQELYDKVARHHQRILDFLIRHDGEGTKSEVIDDIVGGDCKASGACALFQRIGAGEESLIVLNVKRT